ncbi:hypothetical protein [Mesorhizobium sp. M9A.F.Ca.ET.002.03.1.2]|nr:hypothetical protein [Mesorhizobium sp. M9A.F.Ca.ET.002.03.1.2]
MDISETDSGFDLPLEALLALAAVFGSNSLGQHRSDWSCEVEPRLWLETL